MIPTAINGKTKLLLTLVSDQTKPVTEKDHKLHPYTLFLNDSVAILTKPREHDIPTFTTSCESNR